MIADTKFSLCCEKKNNWEKQLSFLPPENIFYLALRNSFDIFSARKIAAFIRRKNIEIIHAHLARDYPLAAFAVRLSKNVKLILTRHVFFPLAFLHKFTLPKDTILIAPTEGGRKNLLEQKILPSGQIRLIYYGIDTAHFVNAKNSIDKDELCRRLNLPLNRRFVGISGEITAHKGQTDFVRAAVKVSEKFPETEFLIFGQDGSPHGKHLARLKNLIKESGLQDKISLIGWFEDVAPVISLLDVFVSASRIEPFGLVIVEAMAAACAVVATATNGATEILINNETGKIVPVENPVKMAEAVNEFLADGELRRSIGRKAQATVVERFDVERMITETEKIYLEAADTN